MVRILIGLALLGAFAALIAADVLAVESLRAKVFADADLPPCDGASATARCVTVLSGTLVTIDGTVGSAIDTALNRVPVEIRCGDRLRRVGLHDLGRPFWRARADRQRLPTPPAPARCHIVDDTLVTVTFPSTGAALTTDDVRYSRLYTTLVAVDAAVVSLCALCAIALIGVVLFSTPAASGPERP
jgi:hypothetical protein